MSQQRSVGSHINYVGIALHIGHEGSLKDRCLVVVPLLALAVASILTCKYLRSLAVVVLIAQTAVEEPALRAIEMLVNEVGLLLLHVLPSQFKHLAL